MTANGFIVVKQVRNEQVGRVIVSFLGSRGILARVDEDDGGDMIPSLELSRGVRVLVSEADAEEAMAALGEFEDDDSEE